MVLGQEILDRLTKLKTKGAQDPIFLAVCNEIRLRRSLYMILSNKTPIKAEQIQKALEDSWS